jgi:hypothetical protein
VIAGGAIGLALCVVLLGAWLVLGRRASAQRERSLVVEAGGIALAPLDGNASSARRPNASTGDQAGVPRWLRGSVRAERFWTPPIRPEPSRAARRAAVFNEPVSDTGMRLNVRYDRVAVLDQPDEAYATTLTEVGTGDEVEVLEIRDVSVRIRTSRGEIGWIPSMTLGAPPMPRAERGPSWDS